MQANKAQITQKIANSTATLRVRKSVLGIWHEQKRL